MKTFLFSLPEKLHNIDKKLDITALLCSKSWIVFNDEGYKKVLIFEEDGSLIISTNGDVITSRWKYIAPNNSILLTIDDKTMMFHPAFLDDVFFALQKDGVEECLFMIDEAGITPFLTASINDIINYFNQLDVRTVASARRTIADKKKKDTLTAEQIEEIKNYLL